MIMVVHDMHPIPYIRGGDLPRWRYMQSKRGNTMARDILAIPAPQADTRIFYGQDPVNFGDLRLPPGGRGKRPVVIVIHGGFWKAQYGLEHTGFMCEALTAAGAATWNIEYRRVGIPGGGYPGTFHDVAAAADYVRQLAPEYNLDLERVITVGHSAGGQLALWLAARHRLPPASELAAPSPVALQGAVSLAGVVHLRLAWEDQSTRQQVAGFLGGTPDEMPDRYAYGSPADLLPLGVPQVLIHGTADQRVPFALSEAYRDMAVAQGDDVHLIPLPGAGHMEVIDPQSLEWPLILQTILAITATSNPFLSDF